MNIEGRAMSAQAVTARSGWWERRALWVKQEDWESSLHTCRPGKPAGNTLAVGHRPGGCEGLSRVHTMVSCGCD